MSAQPRLHCLPDDLWRLVHEYLLPSPDSYCRLHDQAAPLRCTCKIAHAALGQVARGMKNAGECWPAQAPRGRQLLRAVRKIDLGGHVYASQCLRNPKTNVSCTTVAVKGDSCDDRKEIIEALRVISDQAMGGATGLKYYFSCGPAMGAFTCAAAKAKVKLRPSIAQLLQESKTAFVCRGLTIDVQNTCTTSHVR